jgi:hypothetical protein
MKEGKMIICDKCLPTPTERRPARRVQFRLSAIDFGSGPKREGMYSVVQEALNLPRHQADLCETHLREAIAAYTAVMSNYGAVEIHGKF